MELTEIGRLVNERAAHTDADPGDNKPEPAAAAPEKATVANGDTPTAAV